MARTTSDLLTPAEAAIIAEVPIKAVYKTVAERLPKASVIQRFGQTLRRSICPGRIGKSGALLSRGVCMLTVRLVVQVTPFIYLIN